MSKTKPLSRAARAAETRAAIVETAERLFLRSGIEATSLDAVAAELGLTKGAVYASFPSKAALVEAIAVANHSSPTIFEALLEPGVPLADRVRAFGERIVSSKTTRQVVLLDLEYVIYSARNAHWEKRARAEFQSDLQQLAAQFRAANQASGDRLPISEERYLLLLNLLARGMIQELSLHPGTMEVDDIARMLELVVPAAPRAGRRGRRSSPAAGRRKG